MKGKRDESQQEKSGATLQSGEKALKKEKQKLPPLASGGLGDGGRGNGSRYNPK